MSFTFEPAWTQSLTAPPRGLVLAREALQVLVWDQNQWLHLFGAGGQRQAQTRLPSGIVAAAIAEDGSGCTALGEKGELLSFAGGLTPRWQKNLAVAGIAVATDAFGRFLAYATAKGEVHILDADGRQITELHSPRPLHHLAFVPGAPWLVASADYGLVGSFDLAGQWRWRDGLVVHVGALAVRGDGSQLVLACFSEGLRRYGADGRAVGAVSCADSCRLLALSYDASLILVSDLSSQVILLDAQGQVLARQGGERPVVALALGALGDFAVVARADGSLAGVHLRCI